MRLINTHTLGFEEFEGLNIPPYAILSHRWESGEVLYTEMKFGTSYETKPGWNKIVRCCEQARLDEMPYVWIDTCCIDKSSSAELTEAINSMFQWYKEAKVCYAYLCDVSILTTNVMEEGRGGTEKFNHRLDKAFLLQFYGSGWFTRGWTLQELLAPRNVKFFNSSWDILGNKDELCNAITCATCIPSEVLLNERKLSSYTVAQRMSWASKRSTTRVEDLAYSLLGLFNVNMPLLYGEREAAFTRLQEEILRKSNDESILLWEADGLSLLAKSPKAFATHLPHITEEMKFNASILTRYPLDVELRCRFRKERQPYTLTNVGLSITLQLVPWYIDVYLVKLQIQKRVYTKGRGRVFDACIFLQQTVNDSRLARVQVGTEAIRYLDSTDGQSIDSAFLESTGTILRPYVIAHDNWDTSAGEGYLQTWDVKRQRYGFKFSFQNHDCWGPSKILEADNIISRGEWRTPGQTLVLDPGGFEVIAIFRIADTADCPWPYMYFGFTPDFTPTFVQKAWHFKTAFKGFDEFRNTNPERWRRDMAEALSYDHFWESIKRSDPEQELVIQGSQNPHEVTTAKTGIEGLSLMITRWTSGYTFDFLQTQHKVKLVVPERPADKKVPTKGDQESKPVGNNQEQHKPDMKAPAADMEDIDRTVSAPSTTKPHSHQPSRVFNLLSKIGKIERSFSMPNTRQPKPTPTHVRKRSSEIVPAPRVLVNGEEPTTTKQEEIEERRSSVPQITLSTPTEEDVPHDSQ
jgi:hypothetical protein